MREGDAFGPYVLEERLAAGGMAEIFRARKQGAKGFSRQVCIKRILPALCTDAEFVQMFIDEAHTGAQLRHGNIVAIDDFGEVNGQYYLCMELVSGIDLSRAIQLLLSKGRVFPTPVAAYVVGELLKALDYAHRKTDEQGKPLGVIHRDVSPHNVLVSFSGEVKLTDFGIAKAATRIHQTTGQLIKGKLAYMPPEQARGLKLDARADLFPVGVVLFELLTGRRPFAGPTETDLVLAVLRGERPRLRELRSDVPPALEAVCDQLLEADVDRRFASAAQALDALTSTGLSAGGARGLSALLAYFFPEHPSAMRNSTPLPGEALPLAPGQPVPSYDPVALAPTAPSNPRVEIPPEPLPPLPPPPQEPPAPPKTTPVLREKTEQAPLLLDAKALPEGVRESDLLPGAPTIEENFQREFSPHAPTGTVQRPPVPVPAAGETAEIPIVTKRTSTKATGPSPALIAAGITGLATGIALAAYLLR